MLKKYSDLYDEMKKNGNSFEERKSIALKLKLLKEMKNPPREIPPFDEEGFKKLYRDTAMLLWLQVPKKDADELAKLAKETLAIL